MTRRLKIWIFGGCLLGGVGLIAQPLSALCGNCGTNPVLGCYSTMTSNNYCMVLRCTAHGDWDKEPQPALCCFDEMSCAV